MCSLGGFFLPLYDWKHSCLSTRAVLKDDLTVWVIQSLDDADTLSKQSNSDQADDIHYVKSSSQL
jgi:hypothetical protein